MQDRIGVVFVCLGNICRSPLAEGVFRDHVHRAGLEQRFEIDSAGTSVYHHGESPDERSAAVALKRGVRLTGKARQLKRHDLDRFDYVIVMDAENRAAVDRLLDNGSCASAIHRLREFDPEANGDLNVPDPYYGGPQGFENVHDMVDRACAALLQHIKAERGL